jgi:acylphosphatase
MHPSSDSKASGKAKIQPPPSLPQRLSISEPAAKCDSVQIQSFKFEVSGKVQGVFFRKYTQVGNILCYGFWSNTLVLKQCGYEADGRDAEISIIDFWQKTAKQMGLVGWVMNTEHGKLQV